MATQRNWNLQIGTQVGHITDTNLPVHLKTIDGNVHDLLKGPRQMRFNTGMGPVTAQGFKPGTQRQGGGFGTALWNASDRLGKAGRDIARDMLEGSAIVHEADDMLESRGIGSKHRATIGAPVNDETSWGQLGGVQARTLDRGSVSGLPAGDRPIDTTGRELPMGPIAGGAAQPTSPIAMGTGIAPITSSPKRRRGVIPGQGTLF